MRLSRALFFGVILGLAACAREPDIRTLSSGDEGPDEFTVLPGKPLSDPTNYSQLPPPTPGGTNRTDQDPLGDAVAVLGGSRAGKQDQGIRRSDGGMVTYVSRFGVPADIRPALAAEDEDFRNRRGRFTNIRLTRSDRYNEIYKRYHLDAYEELRRWRRAGARTPAVQPGS